MSDNLEEILRLAGDYGFAVLPVHSLNAEGACTCRRGARCGSPAKHPLISAWQRHASTDAETITNWWRRWPWANAGVATGAKSGVFVLDVDVKNGGLDSLQQLQDRIGEIPETLAVQTGSGGFHFYFRLLPGERITNSASQIAPGLDIRGEGGFVVAPPSRHHSGNSYEWINR